MAKSKKPTKSVKTIKNTIKKPIKRVKKVVVKDFKISKEPYPFMTFKITEQTLYWFVMLSLVFCLALWVLSLQLKTTEIIESISMI